MKKISILVVTIFLVFCAIFVFWRLEEHKFRLKHVPDAIGVSDILFANEDSWGFGPGGAETGFMMYALPDESAEKVRRMGIAYLSSMPANRRSFGDSLQGMYDEWHETPVVGSRGVPYIEQGPDCLYCIYIDPDAETAFKNALSKSGSFYAYGRWGMILVVPDEKKVFYLYAG